MKSDNSSRPAPTTRASDRGRIRRILAVDDQDAIIEMLGQALPMFGYEFVGAKEGQGALDRAKEGGIDLILLDLDMPGMGGLEFLSSVASDPMLKQIPVIVMTGSSEGAEKAALAFGARHVVNKPFALMELKKEIAHHLTGALSATDPVGPPIRL